MNTNDADWIKQLCLEEPEAIEQLYTFCYERIYDFLGECRPDLLEYTADCAQVAVDVVLRELQHQTSGKCPPNQQSARPITDVAALAQGCAIGEGKMNLIRQRDTNVISQVHGIALKLSLALEMKYRRPMDEHLDNASDTLEKMMVNADKNVRVRRTLEALTRAVAATQYKNRLRAEKGLPTTYYPEHFDPRDRDLILSYVSESIDVISESIDRCISKLSIRDQHITELKRFTELKSQEISIEIKKLFDKDMNASYINVQWSRIRQALKHCLKLNGLDFDTITVSETVSATGGNQA